MKGLYLTQYFYPEPNFIRSIEYIKKLSEKLDFKIDVLTAFPSYPYGEIYKGYKQKAIDIQYIDGLKIIRLISFINHSSSKLKRLLNYLSFAISTFIFLIFKGHNYKFFYIYHPPLFLPFSVLVFKKLFFKNTKIFIDYQDLWPDQLFINSPNLNKSLLGYYHYIQKNIFKNSTKVIFHTQGFRKHFNNIYGDMSQYCVQNNWSRSYNLKINYPENRKSLHFLYTGNIGLFQDLEKLIDSFKLLDNKKYFLDLFGEGIEKNKLKLKIKNERIKNVCIYDFIQQEELINTINNYDGVIISLSKNKILELTIPSKYQFYLSLGIPIISNLSGEVKYEIKKYNLGINCINNTAAGWSKAFRDFSLLTQKEKSLIRLNCIRTFKENYTLDKNLEGIKNTIIASFKI